MLRHVAGRAWWLVLLRGLAAIVFGLLAWAWPGATLITLTLFWGAYALVDGIAALWSCWHARERGEARGRVMWQVILIGVAFWLLDAKATWFFFQKLVFLPGGMLIPLELLPRTLEVISLALPFATMAYVPGRIASGKA